MRVTSPCRSNRFNASASDLWVMPSGRRLISLKRWAWLSADTMRRVASWRAEAAITEGVLFRRVGVDRRRQRSKEFADPRWGDEDAEGAALLVTYTIETMLLTRQGVTGIYRRIARAAANAGLVDLPAGELDQAIAALSTHSLRVGLTQDLFAAGEDGAGIALVVTVDGAALRTAIAGAERCCGSRIIARAGMNVLLQRSHAA